MTKCKRLMLANSNSCFPMLLWKSGIRELTNITADYKVGMMLTVIVVSLTTHGKQLFESALFKQKSSGKAKARHLQVTFQKMLAYWLWLHKTEFWEIGNKDAKSRAKETIKNCLKYLINHFPQQQGQGWNIAKLHEQLHIPDDIKYNGPLSVTYTGVVEHQHVTSKQHCARTRKYCEMLDKETGDCLYETAVINETLDMIETTMNSLKREVDLTMQQRKHGNRVMQGCKCVIKSNGSVVYSPNGDNVLKENSNNVLLFILGELKLSEGDIFYLLKEITYKERLYHANKTYWSALAARWFD